MTLKEKFETKSSIDTTKEAKVFAKECEDIADEFAIGFAVWLHGQNLEFIDLSSVQQLLSNYKKEQGL